MRIIEIPKTTTETIQVPELHELKISLGDSGPGGDPPHRAFVTVNEEQLCYVDELPEGSGTDVSRLRAAVYDMFLTQLGVPEGAR